MENPENIIQQLPTSKLAKFVYTLNSSEESQEEELQEEVPQQQVLQQRERPQRERPQRGRPQRGRPQISERQKMLKKNLLKENFPNNIRASLTNLNKINERLESIQEITKQIHGQFAVIYNLQSSIYESLSK